MANIARGSFFSWESLTKTINLNCYTICLSSKTSDLRRCIVRNNCAHVFMLQEPPFCLSGSTKRLWLSIDIYQNFVFDGHNVWKDKDCLPICFFWPWRTRTLSWLTTSRGHFSFSTTTSKSNQTDPNAFMNQFIEPSKIKIKNRTVQNRTEQVCPKLFTFNFWDSLSLHFCSL